MLRIAEHQLFEPLKVIKGNTLYTTVRLLDRPAVLRQVGATSHTIFDLARRTDGPLWMVKILHGASYPGRLVADDLRTNYRSSQCRSDYGKIRWTTIRIEGGGKGQPGRIVEHSPDREQMLRDLAAGGRTALFDAMSDKGGTSIAALGADYIANDSPLVPLFSRDCDKLPGSAPILGNPYLIKPMAFAEAQVEGEDQIIEDPFVFGCGPNLDDSDDGELTRYIQELWAAPWMSRIATVNEIASLIPA